MSHYMTALAMKQKKLKPATKIVLYWLADHHNETSKDCFPSIKRLSELCEMSRRSLESHLNILEEFGLIKRINRFRDNGGKTSNGYFLKFSESDTQNLRDPSEKSAHRDTQNLRMNNPIKNNLVTLKDKLFEDFWKSYPKKMAKGQAKKAWAKAFLLDHPQEIIDAAEKYAKAQDGKDKQFIPYPASWLNAERWKDEPEEQKDEMLNLAAKVLKEQING